MAKLTDARVATLQGYFNTGDQPTEGQFAALIQWIQEGIEEHQHDSTGDGDGTGILNGPITLVDDAWIGIGAALERIVFDAAGDIAVMGAAFGIGTLLAGMGAALFAVEGTDGSEEDGPHIVITTDADNYPLFHMINWAHDSIEMMFDAYLDAGGTKSSDPGSSFAIVKGGDEFLIRYDVAAAGAAIAWNTGFVMDVAGDVWFPNLAGVGVRNVSADANGKLVIA